jgi:hypothetical protein
MPCYFFSLSTPFRRRLDLIFRLPPLYSVYPRSENLENHTNNIVSMIFIIFDNYAYELGVNTALAGILALLLGIIGFVMVSLRTRQDDSLNIELRNRVYLPSE